MFTFLGKLTSFFNGKSAEKAKAEEKGAKKIFRYPPVAEGIPALALEDILAGQQKLLDKIYQVVGTEEEWEKYFKPVIKNYAKMVHLLPASETHHHKGVGGLFRHGLEVGLYVLRTTEQKLYGLDLVPKIRLKAKKRYYYACFVAGLCHDIGKPILDMRIMGKNQEEKECLWDPFSYTLYDWIVAKKVHKYFVTWRKNRETDSHEKINTMVLDQVLPLEHRSYIQEFDQTMLLKVIKAIQRDVHTEELAEIVLKADQKSTAEDLKRSNLSTDLGMNVSVSPFRFYIDTMRRLFSSNKWKINETGSKVWVIDDRLFLVWPAAGEDIKTVLKQENINWIPQDPRTILEILLEHNFFELPPPEDKKISFWRILPDILQKKDKKIVALYALQVAQPDILLDVLPSSVPGLVVPDMSDEEIKRILRSKNSSDSESGESDFRETSEESNENHVEQQAHDDVGDFEDIPETFEDSFPEDQIDDDFPEDNQSQGQQKNVVGEKRKENVELRKPPEDEISDKLKKLVQHVQPINKDNADNSNEQSRKEINSVQIGNKNIETTNKEKKEQDDRQQPSSEKISKSETAKTAAHNNEQANKENNSKTLEDKFHEAERFFDENALLAEILSAVAQDISENRKEIGKDVLLGTDIALSWQSKNKFSDGLGVQSREVFRELKEQGWLKSNPAVVNGYSFDIQGKKYLVLKDEAGQHFVNMIKYFQAQTKQKTEKLHACNSQKGLQEPGQAKQKDSTKQDMSLPSKKQPQIKKAQKKDNSRQQKQQQDVPKTNKRQKTKNNNNDNEEWFKIIENKIIRNGSISRAEAIEIIRAIKGCADTKAIKKVSKKYPTRQVNGTNSFVLPKSEGGQRQGGN